MKNQFIHINLYQCKNGFQTPERIFDYHYLLFVHRGSGWFIIDGQKIKAKTGDLFFCKKYSSNVIVADNDDPFLLSGLEFRVDDDIYLEASIKKTYNLIDYPFLKIIISEMIKECANGKIFSNEICSSLLQNLLLQLIRIAKIDSNKPEAEIQNEILKYIQENLNQDLSHKKLQELFSYHRNSINYFLKKVTGMSLTNYVIELRMKYACELLSYSNLSVLEISQKCGYNYQSYFSRQFKKRFGISPNDFRAHITSRHM